MAEDQIYLILAENFYDLVFAGYLHLLGKKVRVIIEKEDLEDSQALLLLAPFRSQLLCGRLGLPLAKEKDPYLPDFQILSPKYRLDFFWDRARREFALNRDLNAQAHKFSALLDRLFQAGKEWEEKIQKFPILSSHPNAEFFLRLFSQIKTFSDQEDSLGKALAKAEISPELKEILIAPLRIFSPHFQENSAWFSSALHWRFLLSGAEGISEPRESFASFLEILTASQTLLLEEPMSLEVSGKQITELRFHSGRRIQADFFFAAPIKILELLNEKDRESRRARSLAERFPRATIFTHFYEMKAEAWPEGMAERVVWISSRKQDPKEFLICAQALTGATKLVYISYGRRKGEVKPLNEDELFQTLVQLFPWLRGERLPKRKEPVAFHQYLKLLPYPDLYPQIRTSFTNLFLPASELVPQMGFPGLFRLAERIAEQGKE